MHGVLQVRPIAVTDVLMGRSGASGASSALDAGASFVLASVQSFLNNVVMVAAPAQTPEEVRATVAGAFGARHHPEHGALSDDEDAGPPSTSSASGAPGGPAGSTPTPTSAAMTVLVIGGPLGGPRNSPSETARTAVLQKDAFLVFRALCKLSIRTSDTATVQDPTAVRGKVGSLGQRRAASWVLSACCVLRCCQPNPLHTHAHTRSRAGAGAGAAQGAAGEQRAHVQAL